MSRRSRRENDNYSTLSAEGLHSNVSQIKKLIIENNETMQKERFRFDEIDYNFIYKVDIFLAVLQLTISLIYIGSWITFSVVRIPRVIISVFSQRCFFKISDMNRRLNYLKFEWITRFATVIIYTLVSLFWSVWLSGQFCELFEGVFDHIRGRQQWHENECQW